MSSSFTPWLKLHLVDVAEKFGANIAAVPLHEKGKRGQIIEFLRVGTENEDAVWASFSDQSLFIPIKFSKEAVIEYKRRHGNNITEGKTALVTIMKFKVVSARVPVPQGGMSGSAKLALLCDSVSLIGRLEETKGNPKSVEFDAELKEWSDGLTKDGGAGNVLKERKKAKTDVVPSVKPGLQEYQRRWEGSIANPMAMVRPEPEPKRRARTPRMEDARDLGSSSPSQKYSVASSPISNWEPTPEKPSRKRKSPSKSPSPSVRSPTPMNRSSSSSPEPEPSSYLTAPTPAQRRVRVMTPPLLFVRKVAPPPSPPPPVESGPERVLAPNSDQGSQPSQPSQPSQVDVEMLDMTPARVKEEDVDVEMLDQDDAQTAIEIFKSPCWPEPHRKRRKVDDPMATGFDWVSGIDKAVVTWKMLYDALRRL
ncbi:hypothetical protein FB45DRAFT_893332 [Roridomyces roridus]|uniref:Shelterin complex subunit TPP1/Est3 domain-containing protein n=1 Tax=Roridomyces roridus TaxID=1738132 RepID=A0AAD7CFD5_9AGAR|nr:hypothetical protein FB45DRAFT_893332 [Roridomyces roridus]